MASRYYYQNGSYNSSPPIPLHLCFFLLTLFLIVGWSWYMSYESVLETLVDRLKLVLIVSPLLLLLAVHWLMSDTRRRLLLLIPLPDDRDSFHRAGGSPWGVALVLVLLLFMVSYQSYFHERWFPLLSHHR